MRVMLAAILLVLIGFIIVAIGYSAEQAALRQEAQSARQISQNFARTLKSQLVTAIKAEGQEGAIPVCQHIAPAIAKQYSADGVQIGRTALKLRNPANAPDAWERSVLEGFSTAMKKGADPQTLERFAFFPNQGGGKTFRYMKAIPVGQTCLACHGSNLSPAVKQALAEKYPDDQAVGFAPGELHGAFTISRKML